MNIGEKILFLRKEHKMTQEVLAEKLNVTRQAVSRWESGLSNPEIETIMELAKIFKINVESLLNENYDAASKNIKKSLIQYFNLQTFISIIILIFGYLLAISTTYIVANSNSKALATGRYWGLLIIAIFLLISILAYAIFRTKFIVKSEYLEEDALTVYKNTSRVYTTAATIFFSFIPLVLTSVFYDFFGIEIVAILPFNQYIFIVMVISPIVYFICKLAVDAIHMQIVFKRIPNNFLLLCIDITFILLISVVMIIIPIRGDVVNGAFRWLLFPFNQLLAFIILVLYFKKKDIPFKKYILNFILLIIYLICCLTFNEILIILSGLIYIGSLCLTKKKKDIFFIWYLKTTSIFWIFMIIDAFYMLDKFNEVNQDPNKTFFLVIINLILATAYVLKLAYHKTRTGHDEIF